MSRNVKQAPPLHPKVSAEELQRMSPDERLEHSKKVAIAAVARYGGRPDLMLQENPHLDFLNPPPRRPGSPANSDRSSRR